MGKTIEKKCWPEFFEAILLGKKNFELRLDNFDCKEGDILILEEWDPKSMKYTGRRLRREVTFVLKTKDLYLFSRESIEKFGYQILSLQNPSQLAGGE